MMPLFSSTLRPAILLLVLTLSPGATLAQEVDHTDASQDSTAFEERRSELYHESWIDFNKNDRQDPYENPGRSLEARVDDLLSRMTLEEKTAQMATLYGYRYVLQDELPQPD